MTTNKNDSAMEPGQSSLLQRLRARFLPSMPDFYRLLIEHAEVVVAGTDTLLRFVQEDDPELGRKVRQLEHEGDKLKARNLQILHKAFATPIDRDDIYRVVESIDEVLNYCKTTVVEMGILQIAPDQHIVEMATLLDSGARSLLQALQHLEAEPERADMDARAARKVERLVEKAYRRGLAELFDPQRLQSEVTAHRPAGEDREAIEVWRQQQTLILVTRVMKRREIYRHLSNAADHLSNAGQVIEDAISKST
jgi:uncharacterized protein